MGFLEKLGDATAELESPKSFFLWSGLTVLSAVVNNKVHIRQPGMMGGINELSPNIFVLLLAPAGLRKGVPIAIARSLVTSVGGTRVISGRSSIQAIIKELANTRTSPGQRTPIKDSTGFVVSGEFSTSLVRDEDALTILTDLYDSRYHTGGWKNTLKHSGVESLKNVCITLLGGINHAHFEDIISSKEVQGGFISRTMVISETRKARKNSLLDEDVVTPSMDPMLSDLKDIAKLKGPFHLDPDAKAEYDRWYASFEEEAYGDKTGTVNRVQDHILKVAQLLALSNYQELHITKSEIEIAIQLCIGVALTNIKPATDGIGEGDDAKKCRVLLRTLLLSDRHRAWRSKILRKHYSDFNVYDLDRIAETWVAAGILLEPYPVYVGPKKSRELCYELHPDIVSELLGELRKEEKVEENTVELKSPFKMGGKKIAGEFDG